MEGANARFAEVHQLIIANFTLDEHTLVKVIPAKRTLFHVFSVGTPCRFDDETVTVEYYSYQKKKEQSRQN
jgi:hypothetical protein